MKALKFIILSLMLVGTLNCTKEVDFDQIDDTEINTSYILTLVYLDLFTQDFLTEFGEEVPVRIDVIQTPISGVTKKYIDKIEFTAVTDNSFDRDFNFQIVLYDASQTPIYSLPEINILANSGETTTILVIPREDIDVVFNAVYFGFVINLLPSNDGNSISFDDDSELNLKSSLELFFKYKTE